MAETTLQDIGLGTIEEQMPGPGLTDYTAYWPEMRDIYLPQLSTKGEDHNLGSRIRSASTVLTCARETILVDGDIAAFGNCVPDIAGSNRPSYVRTLDNWSRTLGNFNPLHGAHDDLVAAASLVMQESAGQGGSSFRPLGIEETVDRHAIAEMKSGAGMVLAGQLLQRAVIIAPEHESVYLPLAEAMHRQATVLLRPDNEQHLGAQLMADDIAFNRFDSQARLAAQTGNFGDVDDSLLSMYRLMKQTAERAGRFSDGVKKGEQDGFNKGRMFEMIMPLLLRDIIIQEIENDTVSVDGGYFSVRQAFDNEEKSAVTNNKLKPAFDMVVRRIFEDDIVATPVQLKCGVGGKVVVRPMKGRLRTEKVNTGPAYLPGIMVLQSRNLNPAQLRLISREMVEKYDARLRGDDVSSLPQSAVLQEQIVQELLVA